MVRVTAKPKKRETREVAKARATARLIHVRDLGLIPVQQEFIAAMVRNGLKFKEASAMMRYAYILEAVRQSDGNKCAAARLIGLHRNSLGRFLRVGV